MNEKRSVARGWKDLEGFSGRLGAEDGLPECVCICTAVLIAASPVELQKVEVQDQAIRVPGAVLSLDSCPQTPV